MLNIMIKELKEFTRETSYLFFFLLFPAILVFLLGNLLQGSDIAEQSIGKLRIDYRIENGDNNQIAAVRGFLASFSKDGSVVFQETMDFEESKKAAGEDEITAAVLFTGNPMEIQVFEGTDRVKNRTVQAILNGFIQNYKTAATVMEASSSGSFAPPDGTGEYVADKNLGAERSMIDYYSVSMVVMIAFMSMMVGAGAFMSEKQDKTINRLLITPQSRTSIFLQKVMGMAPQALLQVAIIMVISAVVFKARYAASLQSNLYLLLLFFVITFCMVSLGAIAGLLIKGSPFVILMPGIWIMMFFGGTYSKEIFIEGISNVMPNYIFQQAAFDVAVFGRYSLANRVILGCIITTIMALVTGAVLFQRKEEER